MDKILTISIAAYNVEPYIRENIESIVASEARDAIEVLIVDDGGKDGTLEIAKKFEEQYPGIVFAVHKENGGYGSVQNYSIAHANGKYFKILDGDDWVDTEGLTKLVAYLKKHDTDVVVTNYYKGSGKDSLKLVSFKKFCTYGKAFDPNQISVGVIGMWALTYRTAVLRASGIVLPEHTLYTDRIYATIPFSYATTMIALDIPVYCYRIGRDGQSVSRESRIKHIDEYLSVTKILCKHYASDKRMHKEYILTKTSAAYKVSIRALLLLPCSRQNYDKLKQYEKEVRSISREVYQKSAKLNTRMGVVITFLRLTGYCGYWLIGKIPKKVIDY